MSDNTPAQIAPATAGIVLPPSVANDLDFQSMVTLAGMMAESGMFPNARDRNKALTLMMLGKEMGVSPVASLNGITVISGKPSLGANLMAAKVKGSGKYDYRVIEHTAEACEIHFLQGAAVIGQSRFTMADARTAGYLNNAQYQKNPRNMLFARAMSNGVKWFCPDVFNGIPVYHEGELELGQTQTAAQPTTPQALPATVSVDEKVRNAGLYFRRTIKGTPDQLAELKGAVPANTWQDVALEAEQKGITTFIGLMRFALGDDAPIDAEFTEEDPKSESPAQSAAPSAASVQRDAGSSGNASANPTSDHDAFGFVPSRWPSPAECMEPRTVAQTGKAQAQAKERGVSEDLYVALRETVLDAFGFLYEDRKGLMSLWIDFLVDATNESLNAATAATYERLGQGALL